MIQLLEVVRVSSTLPWKESYSVGYRGNSSDGPIQ
jgi:hypothetical protein